MKEDAKIVSNISEEGDDKGAHWKNGLQFLQTLASNCSQKPIAL